MARDTHARSALPKLLANSIMLARCASPLVTLPGLFHTAASGEEGCTIWLGALSALVAVVAMSWLSNCKQCLQNNQSLFELFLA